MCPDSAPEFRHMTVNTLGEATYLIIKIMYLLGIPETTKIDEHTILHLLTHWGQDNIVTIIQTFLNAYRVWKSSICFQSKFHWNFLYDPINNKPAFGSVNSLSPVRRQAIIRTNDGLIYWRIYASLGLGLNGVRHIITNRYAYSCTAKLTHRGLSKMTHISDDIFTCILLNEIIVLRSKLCSHCPVDYTSSLV